MPYRYNENAWMPNDSLWVQELEALPALEDDAVPYYPESEGTRSKGKLTQRQLDLYADRILREDRQARVKAHGNTEQRDGILFPNQIKKRRVTEVLNETGSVDPAYTLNSNSQPGMFWRVAPDGRQPHSVEARKKGVSFYADGNISRERQPA